MTRSAGLALPRRRSFVVAVFVTSFGGAPWCAGADCNGNGREDAAELAAGSLHDRNENGVPDECELAQPFFTADPGLQLGRLHGVAHGDLDRDGRDDLIVWYGSTPVPWRRRPAVLLQTASRTFTPSVLPLRTLGETLGGPLLWSGLADFTGDGQSDLLLVTPEGFVLHRHESETLQSSGREVPVYAVRSLESSLRQVTAAALACGDADHDGVADLVVGGGDGPVRLYRGGGENPLGSAVVLDAETRAAALALVDLDGDDDLDLAAIDHASSALVILTNDGSGNFTRSTVTMPTESALAETVPEEAIEKGPWEQLVAADFDLDGRIEIALAGGPQVAIVDRTPGGDWEARVEFRLSHPAWPLVGFWSADVNGDRAVDLVLAGAAGGRAPLYLHNDGAGRFDARVELPLPRGHQLLDVTDLDHDGRADLVAAPADRSSVQVYWQSTGPRRDGPLFSARQQYVGFEPHSSVLRDLDLDGDLDLAAIDGEWNVHVLRNDGDGNLEDGGVFAMHGANELFSLACADLDGDGDLDLVGVDEFGGLYTLTNGGDARFVRGTSRQVGRRPWQVLPVALRGKGPPDILTTNASSNTVSLLGNTGAGGFEALPPLIVESGPAGMAADDFDGDGDLDVAVACAGGDSIVFLENRPPGRLVAGRVIGASRPFEICAADVDGNGAPDLLVTTLGGDSLAAYLQRDGEFQPPRRVRVGRPIRSLTPYDIDADGDVDVATASEFSNSVSILLGNGDGSFGEPTHLPAGYDPRFVVVGDIDADADGDVIAANHSSLDLSIYVFERPPEAPAAYTAAIVTDADLERFAVPGDADLGVVRALKFLAPARREDASLLPLLYQNARQHPLHQGFLAEVFPERFPALPQSDYDRLTGRRATRDYFAGRIEEVLGRGGRSYRFELLSASLDDPNEAPNAEEVRAVFDQLRESFHVGPLVYRPSAGPAREVTATWDDPGFPVAAELERPRVAFAAYTLGETIGRVRLLSSAELAALNERGGITFRDILVLEQAPREIDAVFGGIVTEEPQAELSHIAVRTARRGTPNAFLQDARSALAEWSERLVRFEVTPEGHVVRAATLEEASAWWDRHRPRLSIAPEIDATTHAMPSLREMDLSADRAPPEARYGGKATNLARLQTILDAPWDRYREVGFVIPVAWYLEFLESNELPSARDSSRSVTYEEYLRELEGWDEFAADAELRVRVLASLREHMELHGGVPDELLARLPERMRAVFGSEDAMVRFRSSSNVEDALEFNGAGLYDSTSACLADDRDGDDAGPCACDPERPDERTVERALKRVWASLWNIRAHEERDYFGIPFAETAMAILVSRAFGVERANGVAFTGNPSRAGDERYVVSAQAGEASVVSPEPGELPEKDLLEVADGQVSRITRAQTSSLIPAGEVVLSDGRLRELGALLAHIDARLPIDLAGRRRADVLLDIEFKITREDELAVKQVRPFLRTDAVPPLPVFTLEIPAPLTLCGTFVPSRPATEARALLSWVRFRAGRFHLRVDPEADASRPDGTVVERAQLVEAGRFGPARIGVVRAEEGVFRVRSHVEGEATVYTFRYDQSLELADGRTVSLTIPALRYVVERGRTLNPTVRLDERAVADGLKVEARFERMIHYASCPCEELPLWDIEIEANDGLAIELSKRFRPPRNTAETGPAALVRASVTGGSTARTLASYWDLIYTAGRHNRSEVYWLLLDTPWHVAGLDVPAHAIEIVAPEPRYNVSPSVRYLDEELALLREVAVTAWRNLPAEALLRRGDVDGDALLTAADAYAVGLRVFAADAGERDGVACWKAGDHDDDGDLDPLDVVTGLRRALYLRPDDEPFRCVSDRTPDALTCDDPSACRPAVE